MNKICYFTVFIFSIFSTANFAAEKSEGVNLANEDKIKIPPINAFDFLENIRYGIKTGLFLEDRYFNKENLLNFAHAEVVESLGDDQDWLIVRKVNIQGIGRSMEVIRENTFEKKMTRLGAYFYPPSITADDLIEIFGPVKRIIDPYKNRAESHPVPLITKTHPYGNMEICQTHVNQKIMTDICSVISGSGKASRFSITQTGEN